MAQTFVQSKLAASKVTIFVKTSCPYCASAKQLLQTYKFKMGHLKIVDIDTLNIMDKVQDYFLQITGERTVPQIFIGKTCIGGFDDLVQLDRSGELEEMLTAVGALA